jgi:hypothetical protein
MHALHRIAFLFVCLPLAAQLPLPLPVTGEAANAFERMDRLMTDLLVKYQIPGGALAYSRGAMDTRMSISGCLCSRILYFGSPA